MLVHDGVRSSGGVLKSSPPFFSYPKMYLASRKLVPHTNLKHLRSTDLLIGPNGTHVRRFRANQKLKFFKLYQSIVRKVLLELHKAFETEFNSRFALRSDN